MSKFINSFKDGLQDIKFVIGDGKAVMLARPVVAAVILCFVIYSYTSVGKREISKQRSEISALRAQKEKMSGYQANKDRILQLEKFFPDIKDKNEWLVTQIIENFENNGLRYNFTGSQTEEPTENMLVTSMGLNFKTHYAGAVKLIMDFENSRNYTKVQEFIFAKDDREVGANMYSMKISSAFPKERSDAKKGGGNQ
ncbi:MAG: hypothetical protein LBI01_06560 [Elusimicrobium sp.]|jgi:hypothetical protein|nr:hypothetical protein [Elusimicrobium sp.]